MDAPSTPQRSRSWTTAPSIMFGSCCRPESAMTHQKRRPEIPPLQPWHLAGHMVSRALTLVPLGIATLALGMAIYHWVEGLGWADSFLNAAMLLGGMGPVDP